MPASWGWITKIQDSEQSFKTVRSEAELLDIKVLKQVDSQGLFLNELMIVQDWNSAVRTNSCVQLPLAKPISSIEGARLPLRSTPPAPP
jgi:hypothetical protein